MDSIPDVVFTGENQGDWLGFSASKAGDVNNDSYDDFLVSAVHYGAEGKSYLFLGGLTVDNVPDLVFNGYYVSDAGDMNRDGYDDFMVANPGYNNQTGRVKIYFGNNPVDSTVDFVYYGEAESGQYGYGSSPCGDLNRDGFSDILIGAFGLNDNKGRAYVYYGGRFLHDVPNIRLEGNTGYEERFGYSSSGIADVDNDFVPEIFVGAYYRNAAGGAYLFDEFLDTWVGGPDVCITNSSPVMFSASFHGGAWSLINYGSSASIVSVWHEKVVTVNPGGTSGRFVMFYSTYDSVYTCTKSVRVETNLPVEMSVLSASVHDPNNVMLKWTTAQELNNSGFSIERKCSSEEWTKVGFVNGKETQPCLLTIHILTRAWVPGLMFTGLSRQITTVLLRFSNSPAP
ncbi:MAG: FG-GAP repeat protein [Ignavibacteria bacterium]|nr:FG-GAP repeat protein [Ignavibacteria bacterium]